MPAFRTLNESGVQVAYDNESGEIRGLMSPAGVYTPFLGYQRNRAYKAWRAQPKTYELAAIPDPTIYIDSNRGLDTNAGTKAAPYQTLGKLLTALPTAGACIALANDSLFDLNGTGVSFSTTGSIAVNGASDTNRVTFTNYDPGGYPSQRPRIRNRYLPTSGQWTWDATVQAWYYTNPNGRSFGAYDAMCRFSDGTWGNSRSTNLPALVAGWLSVDRDYYADDTNKRMYVYAPASTDPTTYYGGPDSVILGESERGSLQFSRCGNFVTVNGITFEDCGNGLALANFTASADLAGTIFQRCQFINCGRGITTGGDINSAYTISGQFLENVFRGMAGGGIRLQFKPTLTDIAGNYFSQANLSTSHGGAVYVQGSSSGVQTMAGNRCFENYVEDAKFNRGNCPFDGAGLYFEVRTRGWDCFKNFLTRCHQGVCNNTGATVTVRHNVFDDVDLPYMVGDGSEVNTVNSTFEHNTAFNCGITRYRLGDSALSASRPERDPLRAVLGLFDGISTTAVMNHRNNIIHLAPGVSKLAGMEVRRSATYDASGNHFAGDFTNFVQTYQFGAVADVVQAASTSSSKDVALDDTYAVVSGVPAAPVLSNLPSPLDLYGMSLPVPKKGAVSL